MTTEPDRLEVADEDSGCPPHCCCCGPGEPCCDCGEIMREPTQAERTMVWAGLFRQAADEMPVEAPEDIDPIIWEAQRQAYIAQAEELEGEAAALRATEKPS